MAKICLDAGHGGRDSGAVGFGRYEKNDVLRMVLKVGAILSGKGQEIYYTRDTDIYESPYTKATEANNAGADFSQVSTATRQQVRKHPDTRHSYMRMKTQQKYVLTM